MTFPTDTTNVSSSHKSITETGCTLVRLHLKTEGNTRLKGWKVRALGSDIAIKDVVNRNSH